MIKKHKKSIIWGFLFGTVGMFIIAALSLAVPFFEGIGNVLAAPMRFVSTTLAGNEGSTFEVALLTVGSGILYAVIFFLISLIINRNKN